MLSSPVGKSTSKIISKNIHDGHLVVVARCSSEERGRGRCRWQVMKTKGKRNTHTHLETGAGFFHQLDGRFQLTGYIILMALTDFVLKITTDKPFLSSSLQVTVLPVRGIFEPWKVMESSL